MHFMNCLLVTSPFHARGYSTNLYPANQTTMHLHLNSNLVVHACNQTASLAGLAGLSMQPNNHLLHAHSLVTGAWLSDASQAHGRARLTGEDNQSRPTQTTNQKLQLAWLYEYSNQTKAPCIWQTWPARACTSDASQAPPVLRHCLVLYM